MNTRKEKASVLLTALFYSVLFTMLLLIGYAIFLSFYTPSNYYANKGPASFFTVVEAPTTMDENHSAQTEKTAINRASLEELITLPGIGPVTAKAIIAFRQENGPLHFAEDLLFIKGIGPSALEKIRSYISFD